MCLKKLVKSPTLIAFIINLVLFSALFNVVADDPLQLFPVWTEQEESTLVTAYVSEDMDGDGMLNKWERYYGFDPTDPTDALLDSDLDGLTNLEEHNIGTHPRWDDTDGGGMTDGDEISSGRNPLDPSDDNLQTVPPIERDVTEKDTDGDKIPDDLERSTYLTNPYSADSDKDGLDDYQEIFVYHTDPNLKDTDFDGLLDPDEIFTHKTSPILWDSDGGGDPDGDEINNGTDPLLPDDDLGLDWRLYIGKKSFDTKLSKFKNKTETVVGVNMTLEINKAKDIQYIIVKLDSAAVGIAREPYSEFEVETPQEPGLYLLKFQVPSTEDPSKYLFITHYIEVKPQGTVYRNLAGTFENWFHPIFPANYVDRAQISINRYNSTTHKSFRYVSEYFYQDSPVYSSENGKYVVMLDPGLYKIQYTKELVFDQEILISVDEPTIFSDNVRMTQNLDIVAWGVIFTGIYSVSWILVRSLLNRVENYRYDSPIPIPLRHLRRKSHNS